jgi:magnesium transporter
VVPTRRLLLSPLDKRIADIMAGQIVALPAAATVLDACEFFTLHRFLAFPVVDDGRHLIGVIDVELYTEGLTTLSDDEKTDDLFQLIGVHLAQARPPSPVAAFRSRFPWLTCNLAGGIVAAFLSGLYQDELSRVVALAMFIPVVLTLAESVGIQSVSLAVQALHGQAPNWPALLKKLRWELLAGFLLGGASGVLVGLVALVWLGQTKLALCLLGGIVGSVTCSAGLGFAIPNLCRLFQRDPRLAAGPISLALSDIVTLLLYFNLARWLLA